MSKYLPRVFVTETGDHVSFSVSLLKLDAQVFLPFFGAEVTYLETLWIFEVVDILRTLVGKALDTRAL